MKGTIVSSWIKTCRKLYGNELTNEAMEYVGINPKKVFTPTEDIKDEKAIGIIEYMTKKLDKPSIEIWREMGKNNIKTFSQDYPTFFRYDNLYSFLEAMYDIHIVVTKKIPGAKPPILNIEPIGSYKAAMTYSSPRGMFGYFQGMLEGASNYFGEEIEIKTVEKREEFIKLHITFPEKIYENRDYRINNFFSFGFAKNLELKIGLGSLIFIGIPYIIGTNFLKTSIIIPITLLLTFLVPYTISKALFLPKDKILKSLEGMANRNFSIYSNISTKDFFEEINLKINDVKKTLKSDFVGYKGTTDELNVFANKFNEISQNMNYTSQEISHVVEQVAEGAVNQADETENSAYLLNKSIDSLNNVVDKENKGKEDLETTVERINDGYEDLKNTSNKLSNILNQFSLLKKSGLKLQSRARDVNNIVETVEEISDKTNLLALNASIEASRAGEYGQGFTVVAMEIRELAKNSKAAVKSINNNLETFIEEIHELVEEIEDQYSILEKENETLSNIASEDYVTVLSIKSVSDLIIELISELNNESKSLNKISSNIESLAAIAEENSASSEEVSANIITYTEEIEKMTKNISEFKKVSKQFGKELEKYKI
ncbi:heme NO-binding domain-containing protein [Anaerosalibacter massiliensis]|uniref:Heme NO-binding domain-containing protein n=1 Tax=Anaerosalibacter massiliensis TaxID=1347392 RepID=A0A9X2MIA5_9FIRM|nr:heme NO-binding domain-containing protein [Anaerosalibacter massiliensis]MCR2044214.1 heme NO-binding domain-containing protein [Anaerosalibacter massiliensis]